MEALRLPPFQGLLRLPSRRTKSATITPSSVQQTPTKPPFINATLSKQAAEVLPMSTPSPARHSPISSESMTVSTPRKRVSPSSLQYEQGYLGAVPDRTVGDGSSNVSNAMENLTNILTSKVYDVAIESQLQLAPKMSERLGVNVWLKREDSQPLYFFIDLVLEEGRVIESNMNLSVIEENMVVDWTEWRERIFVPDST